LEVLEEPDFYREVSGTATEIPFERNIVVECEDMNAATSARAVEVRTDLLQFLLIVFQVDQPRRTRGIVNPI
jgi:hypothetical protein